MRFIKNHIFTLIAFLCAVSHFFGIFMSRPVYGNLTTYEGSVKTGVFDQMINIDYGDEIYTDKMLNARLLFILDQMNSKPAKTSIVKGFDEALQDDIVYASNIVQPTPGNANDAYKITLASSTQKDQIQEGSTIEIAMVPTAGFTNYVYVPVGTGKTGGGLSSVQISVLPIDPTLIVGISAGAGNGVPSNAAINIIGSYFAQDTGSPVPVSTFPAVITNYVQEQKTSYAYSTIAAKENLYTKGTIKNMKDERAKRSHLLLKEKTLLFNGPAYAKHIAASTDTVDEGYMGGLIYNIKTNSPNSTKYNVWSYDAFDAWQYGIFDPELDDNVGKRMLVCNKAFRKFFTDLKKDKPGIDWAPNGTYGIPGIRTVVTDAGEFDVMVHPRIHARYPAMDKPFGIALYLPYIELKPMINTTLRANIQSPENTGFKSEYYSAWTYLLHQPVYHGIIYQG